MKTITFNGEEGKADISYAKTGYVEGGGNTYTKGIATKVYYTITVKNTGNIEGAFSFEDVLDSDITDISYTASLSNGGSTDSLVSKSGNTITGNGSLPANSTLTVNITGTLKTDKDSIANELDGKTVTFTGKDAAPNFVFEKTGQVGSGGNTYISGDGKEESATYTIKVTNNGTADGTIEFTDTMPEGVTLNGMTPASIEGVTLDTDKNQIVVSKKLAVGETLTITLNVTIADNATTELSNTLTGIDAGNGTYGGDTGETFYSTEATINISANKSGYVGKSGNVKYEVGDEVTYEIAVSNSGNTDATNVSVVDTQPDGIQFTSYKIGTDAAVALTGDLNISIPTVKKGESVTVTITGKVVSIPTANDGKIDNTATVDGSNTGKVTFEPKKPNLTIGKQVNGKDSVDILANTADQTLTFTITGRSTGDAAAKNVVIKDTDLKTYVDGGQLIVSGISAEIRETNQQSNTTPINVTYEQLVSESGFVIDTLEPKTEVVITIECKTTDTVSSIFNTATMKADDVIEQEDTATATPPKYAAEKWIVDASGNTIVDKNGKSSKWILRAFSTTGGQEIIYRMAFYNNSGETIKDLQVSDYGYWSTPRSIDEVLQLKVVESKLCDLAVGDVSQAATGFRAPTDPNSDWFIDFKDVNLQSGGCVIFEYTATTLGLRRKIWK